ncbi:MAG TPA: glycosyltransferase family 2 protein, partial [Christiangramia sp.]|nr:glycosyltransferase family 2 protein [Christiangramia sp.]
MKCRKVSFIVPIYNVAQYLHTCLDSILKQSVKNIEVICINDCSSDKSQDIIDSFAKKDERIKSIKFAQNKGPGAARNSGFAAATGDYIRMVDGDDYIPLESTEKLLQAALEHGSNFVRGGFAYCNKKNEITKGYS